MRLNVVRIESRAFLKCLIALNVSFFLYQLYSFNYFNKNSNPCVIVMNNSSSYLSPEKLKILADENLNTKEKNVDSAPSKAETFVIKENLLSNQNSKLVLEETESKIKVDSNIKEEESKKSWWKFETRTNYNVLRNYIIATNQKVDLDGTVLRTNDFENSVTYTTQGSYEFLHHSEQLCKRFDGPVSISVYSPSSEFQIAINLIYYLRECGNPCVKSNISWHMVYDASFPVDNLNINKYPDEFLIDNNVNLNFNCSLKYKDYLNQLIKTYDLDDKKNVLNVRTKNNLPYPINVLRNVARLSANTKYVLASDIELYPSINIVKMFKVYLEKEKKNQVKLVDPKKPHVYILPIFEVDESVLVPETKADLVKMLKTGEAIFFHKWVCDACQRFVDRDKWIEETSSTNELNIFRKTRRNKTYWEPLYIGTNDEPLYDERLSWNGKRDKMSQMLEMCLISYDLLILDNAFLCHAPGIKKIDPDDQKKRLKFIIKNNKIYDEAVSKLRRKYSSSSRNC